MCYITKFYMYLQLVRVLLTVSDFSVTTSEVTFGSTTSTGCIPITIWGDNFIEGTERFSAYFELSSVIQSSNSMTDIIISDNDGE